MNGSRYLILAALATGILCFGDSPIVAADAPKSKQQKKKEQQAAQKQKLREEQKAKQQAEAKKAAQAAKLAAAKKAAAEKAAREARAKKESEPLPSSVQFKSDVPAALARLPEARDPAALAKLIDRHNTGALTEDQIPASPNCSDEEFLRRAYLDLTGVIPTAEKAKQFLDSTDPQKRPRLIDELLADPNYGRHLADLWIPKLYPKDSNNRFVLKDPLYNWYKDNFNQNTRWDKFVFDQVTATGAVDENPAVTYFLANRAVDKITDTVTQHYLGIQLQCAQCHNHPFTGWKQQEYWGMASFFSKVNADRPRNANKGGDNTKIGVSELASKTKQRDFFPEATMDVSAKFLGGPEPKLEGREPYRPILASWMVSAENPYFARAMVNRTWARLFGRGIVNPVDDMHPDNPPSHPELLDEMAQAFAGSGFDVKFLTRAICLSNAYQRSSKPTEGNEDADDYFARMSMKVMIPEQLFDSLNLVTGQAANQSPGRREKLADRRGNNNPRDAFVAFFLAGGEEANAVEYEAGIPQALRLMNNSRLAGNPTTARNIAGANSKPEHAIENLYLATLSRRPTSEESARLTGYVAQASNSTEAYSDILWALLNSSEFTMVR